MTLDGRDNECLGPLLQRAAARRVPLPDPPMRRLLRVRAGLTQAELAGLLGVRRNAVTRYETGDREPRGQTRASYADLLIALAMGGGQQA
jgi:DNA-binding XRE family transcriptional regulator